jgi:hypothetical protein
MDVGERFGRATGATRGPRGRLADVTFAAGMGAASALG